MSFVNKLRNPENVTEYLWSRNFLHIHSDMYCLVNEGYLFAISLHCVTCYHRKPDMQAQITTCTIRSPACNYFSSLVFRDLLKNRWRFLTRLIH